MDTKNYSDETCRADVPQDQAYMSMSDVAGQDQIAASGDMLKAMVTPGGLLKKVADSSGPQLTGTEDTEY